MRVKNRSQTHFAAGVDTNRIRNDESNRPEQEQHGLCKGHTSCQHPSSATATTGKGCYRHAQGAPHLRSLRTQRRTGLFAGSRIALKHSRRPPLQQTKHRTQSQGKLTKRALTPKQRMQVVPVREPRSR
jgi:hypothetical protein